MIYSTNRTASLSDDITVDVNESYFGLGALDFMQENAQDELALFEAAIKSDIDEFLIGESADELTALNEGFVQNAANKIKELMRKFIEWLKSITRSAIAKLSQLLVRDNEQFVKMAKTRISKMPNPGKFKYSGKALKLSDEKDKIENGLKSKVESIKAKYDKAASESSKEQLESLKSDVDKLVEEFNALNVREDFNKQCVYDASDEGIGFVEKHLKVLEGASKKDLKGIKDDLKKFEKEAKDLAKKAEAKAKKDEKDEVEKVRLSVMASIANSYKTCAQKYVSDSLYITKQNVKIARAVVAKAMGATPKNEGFEFEEEFIDAMIEDANYEYDEALEEMSEAKECDDSEDGAEPDEDEE